MTVEMELVSVEAPERPTRTPVVILREVAGQRRVLPIFIGVPEAQAIALTMQFTDRKPEAIWMMVSLLAVVGVLMHFLNRGSIDRYYKWGVVLYSLPFVAGGALFVLFALERMLYRSPAANVSD